LAVEEIASGSNLIEVLVASDVGDTRSSAVFEMSVEAMLVIALVRGERPATAEMILAADK
jgi:hypothetical protein